MGFKIKHKEVGAKCSQTEWKAEDLHEFVEMNLGDLSDVNAPTPADNDLFAFNAATGLWVPKALSSYAVGDLPAIDLNDLADVVITAPTLWNPLAYEDPPGRWVNAPFNFADHHARHENGAADEIDLTGLTGKILNLIEDTTPQLGGDLDAQDKAITALKKLVFGVPVELTISGGAVTVTRSGHLVDTEGDAATDDLDTINGGSPGQLLFIAPISSAREVVLRHGTGNIWLHAKADLRLQDIRQSVFMVLVGGWWVDVSRELLLDEADWGIIHDFTNFGELVAGSGSTVRDIRKARVLTGMTADSYGQAYKGLPPDPFDFDRDTSFYIVFMPYAFGSNTVGYMTVQIQRQASDPTNKAFGFRLDHLALKGIVHNGASLAVVDLSTTLVNNTKYALKMAYTAGSKIEWFVDGVLKGSSTHLPSGTLAQTSLVIAAKNPANGLNFATHEVGRWAYRQSW